MCQVNLVNIQSIKSACVCLFSDRNWGAMLTQDISLEVKLANVILITSPIDCWLNFKKLDWYQIPNTPHGLIMGWLLVLTGAVTYEIHVFATCRKCAEFGCHVCVIFNSSLLINRSNTWWTLPCQWKLGRNPETALYCRHWWVVTRQYLNFFFFFFSEDLLLIF